MMDSNPARPHAKGRTDIPAGPAATGRSTAASSDGAAEWSCDDAGAAAAAGPAAAAGDIDAPFHVEFQHPPSRLLGWAGACIRLRVRGAFERKVAWALRLSVTCTLALTVATAPILAERLPGPFLCPVLAVLACVSTIGESFNMAWQIVKGAFYAALFGFILFACGINRANDSRVETLVLLFFFCMWSKYFIHTEELTTKKLAVSISATILITQLNYTDEWNYCWKVFFVACLASLSGVIGSVFPFPNSALKEAEERWTHALRQTAHLFHLLVEAFSCTNRGDLDAKLLLVRIEQTIGHLLANRDALKARIKEAEYEFPILLYHWVFGTHNNYTWTRMVVHFASFEQLCSYMQCMLFAVQRLPFDDFHNVAVAHLARDLHAVAHALAAWVGAVAAADRSVHRAHILAEPLARYSQCVAALFHNYVRFRAKMYFNGNLFLVDMLDGQKALLRQGANRAPARTRKRKPKGAGSSPSDDADRAQSVSRTGAATSDPMAFHVHKARSPALTRSSLSPAYSSVLSRYQEVTGGAGIVSPVLSAVYVSPEPQLSNAVSPPPPLPLPPTHRGEQSLLTLPKLRSAVSTAAGTPASTAAAAGATTPQALRIRRNSSEPANSFLSEPSAATSADSHAATAGAGSQARVLSSFPGLSPSPAPALSTAHSLAGPSLATRVASPTGAAAANGAKGTPGAATATPQPKVCPADDNNKDGDSSDRPELEAECRGSDGAEQQPLLADFTWTSNDVMSLNFFFFQTNEFTKRALKFAAEPGEEYAHHLRDGRTGRGLANSASEMDAPVRPASETGGAWFDPAAHYHLGSVRRVPPFLAAFIRSTLRSQWAGLRASCVWDRQRFIEAAKLALAIVLASANELTPRSWTPIYERKSHGWWAPVTLAFTMGDNLGSHVTNMNLRVLGTLAGAVFGYICATVCRGNLVALVAVLVVWNVITTVQRTDPKFGYAWLVAGFTASVVAVGSNPLLGSVSQFALVRIEETLAGVLVGMFVHNFIFPLRAGTLLQNEVVANLERVSQAFCYAFGKYQVRAGQLAMGYSGGSGKAGSDAAPARTEAAGQSNDLLANGISASAAGAAPEQPRSDSAGLAPVAENAATSAIAAPAAVAAAAKPSNELEVVVEKDEWRSTPAPSMSQSAEPLMSGAVSAPPSESPPAESSGPAAAEAGTSATASTTGLDLNPLHSFRRLGPALQRSIDAQNRLRSAAAGEPTLWHPPFPGEAYARVTDLQRTIALYLFVMDLSLRRIVQSESHYLMPDLHDNFARLRASVVHSIDEIVRGIQEHAQSRRSSIDGDDGAQNPPLESRGVSGAGLQSLHASLEELDARYKRWIDMRVLAKRNAADHMVMRPPVPAPLADEDSELEAEPDYTSPSRRSGREQFQQPDRDREQEYTVSQPRGLRVHVVDGADEQEQANASGPHLQPVGVGEAMSGVGGFDDRPLKPIPLFTPLNRPRRLSETQTQSRSFTVLPFILSPPRLPLGDGDQTEAHRHSHPLALGASSSGSSAAGLSQLDVAFTRSMDVLALNSFLFATKGLISKLMLLSQAVRVLLHMRRPGVFEEEF